MIYKNGWRVREVPSPVRKEQKIMEGNTTIEIGSVYQMTGEFKISRNTMPFVSRQLDEIKLN